MQVIFFKVVKRRSVLINRWRVILIHYLFNLRQMKQVSVHINAYVTAQTPEK